MDPYITFEVRLFSVPYHLQVILITVYNRFFGSSVIWSVTYQGCDTTNAILAQKNKKSLLKLKISGINVEVLN